MLEVVIIHIYIIKMGDHSIWELASSGKEEELEGLLTRRPEALHERGGFASMPPVYYSIIKRNPGTARLLVDKGASLDDKGSIIVLTCNDEDDKRIISYCMSACAARAM